MKNVYLLKHIYEEEELENIKEIGLYTSLERAEMIAQKYRAFEGFRDYPDSFYIFMFEINKNYWEDGFKRIGIKDVPMFIIDLNEYLQNQKKYLSRNIDNEEIKRLEFKIENEPNELEVLFELEHAYEIEADIEVVKTIGVFTSRHLAEQTIEKYKFLPGFKYYPDGFIISEYNSNMINRNYWDGGFFKWTSE